MKLFSWNVNGIRAVINKGEFQKFVAEYDPDVICLQETKAMQGQAVIDLPQYQEYWNSAAKKGYSGTAIFSKTKPLGVVNGFPPEIVKEFGIDSDSYGDPNEEGRVIAAEFETFYVVTVYTPNSKGDLSRLNLRYKHWDPAFLAYIKMLETTGLPDSTLDLNGIQSVKSGGSISDSGGKQATAIHGQGKPVLVCGDLNVAHTEEDLANPKSNVGKHGFTDEERQGFDNFVSAGFIDTFRLFTKGNGHYSWWTHWANSRARNVGWRIDYWLASAKLKDKIKLSQIHASQMGSDHCPVSIEIDI